MAMLRSVLQCRPLPTYISRKLLLIPLLLFPNSLIRRDLSCPTVKEEIRRYSSHYGDRLLVHPNHLAVNLLRLPDNRRLRRFLPTDLPDRF
jgi:hypothetical protein